MVLVSALGGAEERVGRAKYRRRVVLDGALLEVAPHVCSLVIVFVYQLVLKYGEC